MFTRVSVVKLLATQMRNFIASDDDTEGPRLVAAYLMIRSCRAAASTSPIPFRESTGKGIHIELSSTTGSLGHRLSQSALEPLTTAPNHGGHDNSDFTARCVVWRGRLSKKALNA